MSALIERDFDFHACVYFENQFMINQYDFSLVLEVNTDSIYEQNIAMDRLKYLVYECFENSVFVRMDQTDILEKYTNAGLKVCIIPEDPYDQIIALLIVLKANAVCEDKLKIFNIGLTSKLSDGVKFMENNETAINALPSDGWWNNKSPSLCSNSQLKKDKVVKIIKDEWAELNLSWKEKRNKTTEVMFTNKLKKDPE